MFYSLLKTLLLQPSLVVTHARNYIELFRYEFTGSVRRLATTFIAWVVCGLFVLLGLLLAGVAVMVGVMQNQFHWVLVLVPGAAFVMAFLALVMATRRVDYSPVDQVKSQFASDVTALLDGDPHAP